MGGEGDGVSYKEVVPFRPTYTILCSFTIPCEYFIVHTMALLGLYVFFHSMGFKVYEYCHHTRDLLPHWAKYICASLNS